MTNIIIYAGILYLAFVLLGVYWIKVKGGAEITINDKRRPALELIVNILYALLFPVIMIPVLVIALIIIIRR